MLVGTCALKVYLKVGLEFVVRIPSDKDRPLLTQQVRRTLCHWKLSNYYSQPDYSHGKAGVSGVVPVYSLNFILLCIRE